MWNGNNPYTFADPSGYDAIVTVEGNNVTINVPVKFQGGTDEDRARVSSLISQQFSGKFGDYHVTTKVTEGALNGLANTITFDDNGGTNVTVESGTMSHMHLNMTDPNIAYGIKHEAGHLLGLQDEYTKILNDKGEMVGSTPHPGFEANLMGRNGAYDLTERQIDQIISSLQNVRNI
jgi:hypothetical protein